VALAKKLEALNRVYEIYDAFSSTLALACKEKCAHCCTSNVTLTTLEGYKIVDQLISAGKLDVIDRLKGMEEMRRFQPQLCSGAGDLGRRDGRINPSLLNHGGLWQPHEYIRRCTVPGRLCARHWYGPYSNAADIHYRS
jgi:hypothetical protein